MKREIDKSVTTKFRLLFKKKPRSLFLLFEVNIKIATIINTVFQTSQKYLLFHQQIFVGKNEIVSRMLESHSLVNLVVSVKIS